jgi:hypothetical protein
LLHSELMRDNTIDKSVSYSSISNPGSFNIRSSPNGPSLRRALNFDESAPPIRRVRWSALLGGYGEARTTIAPAVALLITLLMVL